MVNPASHTMPDQVTIEHLEMLKEQEEPVDSIIVLGKSGAGKSTLIESITGRTGLVGDGVSEATTCCQLASAMINDQKYIFVDTPGFKDEATAMDVLYGILSFLDRIKNNIRVVKVWYLIDNSLPVDAMECKLRAMLDAFCGREFIRNTTIITTYWGNGSPSETRDLEKMLEGRMKSWAAFVEAGAKTYHHGKVYVDGKATSDILDWSTKSGELKAQATIMLFHENNSTVSPAIIDELRHGFPIGATLAASVFRLRTSTKSSSGGSSNGFNSPNNEDPADFEPPKYQQSGSDKTTEPKMRQTSDSSDPSIGERIRDEFFNIGSKLIRDAAWGLFKSLTGFAAPSAGDLGGLDIANSSVDFCKSRGLDSRLSARRGYAALLGVDVGAIGTAAGNRQLHDAMKANNW